MDKRATPLSLSMRDTVPPPSTDPGLDDRGDLVRVTRFLRRLVAASYFGKVTLSFQNGKVTDLRTEQVMKIDDL